MKKEYIIQRYSKTLKRWMNFSKPYNNQFEPSIIINRRIVAEQGESQYRLMCRSITEWEEVKPEC